MEKYRPTGRPRLYDDPIFFEERVDAYFDDCQARGKPPTIAGISYFLGFDDKQSFGRYADYEGFSLTVKKARLRIEAEKNEMLFDKGVSTAGVIFDLKNNHGWADQIRHGEMTPSEFGQEAARVLRQIEEATAQTPEDGEPEAADADA